VINTTINKTAADLSKTTSIFYDRAIFFVGHCTVFTSMGHISIKLKKSKLLSRLTWVLKENYKYAEKQNLEEKQIFA
jgi:hypothetical protein